MPSRKKTEDLSNEPDDMPTSINPYEVLAVDKDATEEQIKKAYRKAALKHHPDKASGDAKLTAHTEFQRIAFAYAILSDTRRRQRYDTTGRTDEAVDLDDDDFDWISFFRAQYAEVVTTEKLSSFKDSYRGSEEERGHILAAYKKGKGNMNRVYEEVMLSNPLEDEERFCGILDKAIDSGEIEALDKYTKESQKSKDERMKRAKREAKEAEQAKEEIEAKKSKQKETKASSNKPGSLDDLAAMIQKRQAGGSRFLEHLEEKYTAGPAKAKKGKRSRDVDDDMPSEEAFLATRAKLEKGKEKKTKSK